MAIDLATIGKRLKEARQNCGVSQEDAAEAIGVPRTAIVHLEAGNRSISTVELLDLARLYKRPVIEFLAEEDAVEEDILVALHRLTGDDLTDSDVEREVERCVEMCREGYQLESILERRPRNGPPAYPLPAPRTYAEAAEQGETIAREERTRLGLGLSPVQDMAELLSCEGIWASGARLPDGMSGLFLHQPSIGFVVLVNYAHPRGRKRFSYAHEYAHALLDQKRSVNVTSRKNANELFEKRANAFAASFLVPKGGVEHFLATLNKGGASRRNFHIFDVAADEWTETERRVRASEQEITYQDAALLASHYGVSYQVAVYRLGDLGYVNRDELKALLDKGGVADTYLDLIGRRHDVSGKPTPDDRELVGQIVPLALEAFRREEISRGKLLELAKLLGLEGRRLTALV
jgi:Zn-dependent peptidase ImmA (M78 family)/transcriptional regulator with XRE-family HTH domain